MESDIKMEEGNDEKSDFMKLKRPQGRPPTRLIPKIFYWFSVIVETIMINPPLLLGAIGGMGGYYIGQSFEMVIVGIIVGIVVGFILFEDK